MTLKREIQLRKGNVSLSIFKGEMDGKILVSFDKEYVSRRVKGPLFSEEEMYELVQLVLEYDEWESKAITGSANRRLIHEPPERETVSLADVQAAIGTARKVSVSPQPKTDNAEGAGQAKRDKNASITVLPSIPEFREIPSPTRVQQPRSAGCRQEWYYARARSPMRSSNRCIGAWKP